MKPIFSEEEKIQAVRTFLIALQHNKVKINSYRDVTYRLNSGEIRILTEISKSGLESIRVPYRGVESVSCYSDADARLYFEWLVSAVSGTLPISIIDALIKSANDQLFRLIQVMQQSNSVLVDSKIQMIEPYDWQVLFTSFDERLMEMQRIIDKRDKDIMEFLQTMLPLVKENTKLLKILEEEYNELYKEGK